MTPDPSNTPISDLAGIDPSYAELLDDDCPHCTGMGRALDAQARELEAAKVENERLRGIIESSRNIETANNALAQKEQHVCDVFEEDTTCSQCGKALAQGETCGQGWSDDR